MLKLTKEMPMFLKKNELFLKNIEKLNQKDSFFNYYSKAYMTTNENINDFFDDMNFRNKRILTVVGSGDYIFNAVLRGSKKIDGFDISIYAIMFYYLKEAALHALSYEEFMNFLYYKESIDYFSKDIFFKVRPYLNYNALPFWNLIFLSENKINFLENIKKIPLMIEENFENIKNLSAIYEKVNYELLQANIKNASIRIFLEDFKTLNYLNGPYDYILLSNILNYINDVEFRKLLKMYQKKLSINGEIKNYLLLPDYVLMRGYDHILEVKNAVDIIMSDDEFLYGGNYILTKRK